MIGLKTIGAKFMAAALNYCAMERKLRDLPDGPERDAVIEEQKMWRNRMLSLSDPARIEVGTPMEDGSVVIG